MQENSEWYSYETFLESGNTKAESWYKLALIGGGKVNRIIWSEKECYERTLAYNNNIKYAWQQLSKLGGGIVKGIIYSSDECSDMADLCH